MGEELARGDDFGVGRGDGAGEAEGVAEGLADGDGVGVGAALDDGEADGVGEGVGVGEADGVGEGVGVGEADGVGVGVGRGVGGVLDPPLDESDKGSDTTNVKVAVDVTEFPSVAVTVNVVDVNKTVGVPDICPVEVSKVNPVGRAGDIEYSIGDVPPDAVIGVNAVAAVPLVKDLVDTAVDAVIGFIVTEVEKVAVAVSPLLSVAVTV